MNISVLLFDKAELLDWAGPAEVFLIASRYADQSVNIQYFGYGSERLNSGGLTLYCNGLWTQVDEFSPDVVIIPGGPGVRWILTDQSSRVLNECYSSGTVLASVCTGALLLAHAGLLNGRKATTHHENYDELARLAPKCEIERDVRFSASPPIFSAGGISSGIDLALALVARYIDRDTARQTADFMEYSYDGSSAE